MFCLEEMLLCYSKLTHYRGFLSGRMNCVAQRLFLLRFRQVCFEEKTSVWSCMITGQWFPDAPRFGWAFRSGRLAGRLRCDHAHVTKI